MSEAERDPMWYWRQNNVPICRHCSTGIAVGANQCVKGGPGRNVRLTDHSSPEGLFVIEAADMDDFMRAIDIARKVRTVD